ncbi:NYN domain-containing protein [Anabaena variabilis FACHB-164]|uniref:NYN domain-containing protein n=1 Tax=Anabaena variabilis TaxID=264691 RepID=UPI0016834509|nr:NYN domain-containing protein [Trichormus variabilis]MBD2625083.1 NYN domain-containing protein [Trichormus variabilis FACHB-164]
MNTQTVQKKDSVGIFGDIQNVLSIKKYGDLLLDFAKMQGNIKSKNFYYNSLHKNQVDAKNIFQLLGFNCVDVPDSSKNSADKQLKDECYNAVAFNPSLKTIILLSGDGDFAVLIAILKAMGKEVIVFAQRGSASPKLINLVGINNFHFIDELPQLVGEKTLPQSTVINPQVSYNEAEGYLIETVKNALSQGKPTHYSYIGRSMRQLFPKYQGVSSISALNGKKFKSFGKFIDYAVNSGRIQRQNQELLLIE